MEAGVVKAGLPEKVGVGAVLADFCVKSMLKRRNLPGTDQGGWLL